MPGHGGPALKHDRVKLSVMVAGIVVELSHILVDKCFVDFIVIGIALGYATIVQSLLGFFPLFFLVVHNIIRLKNFLCEPNNEELRKVLPAVCPTFIILGLAVVAIGFSHIMMVALHGLVGFAVCAFGFAIVAVMGIEVGPVSVVFCFVEILVGLASAVVCLVAGIAGFRHESVELSVAAMPRRVTVFAMSMAMVG